MLYWIVVLLMLAAAAGLLGFGGIASTAAGLAQTLFAIFLLLLMVSIAFAAIRRR
jgi:uncharacterized membrane protein YtjA (UPF0391 family)